MKTIGYTKGEWEVNHGQTYIPINGKVMCLIDTNRKLDVGNVVAKAFGDTREEAEANASLIAASQNMLKRLRKTDVKLKRSLAYIKANVPEYSTLISGLKECISLNNAAIKKATTQKKV